MSESNIHKQPNTALPISSDPSTMEPIHRPFKKILIVGAGPAGLLLAILLAQHHISSVVLEAWTELDNRLRATQYGVPATRIFRRAGILDDIRSESIGSFPSICWRNAATKEKLASIDLSAVEKESDRMTVLSLNQILRIMLRHCQEKYSDYVVVKFNHKVIDVHQDEKRTWAFVEIGIPDKREHIPFEGDYIVGCDGGQSMVRKCLFGRDWPGETFESKLLVQNVFYDGFRKHGWDGANYMIGPEFWGLIAKRGKPQGNDGDLWRVTYGETAVGVSDEEYLRRRNIAFKKLLPGSPEPSQYKASQADIFRMHNRCVEKMRVGRIFLAADAAHICNPFGGYGCMAGILDVGGLAECLTGYYEGNAEESILDLYARVRREKFLDFIDKRSRKNLLRISKTDPETALKTDSFLKMLKTMEGKQQETQQFLMKDSSIEYDFTQHYKITRRCFPPNQQ